MADLTTRLAQFLNALGSGSMIGFWGSGQTQGNVSGTLYPRPGDVLTPVGTTAVVTEEDLATYTLPANTLSEDGKGVRVTAFGDFAANSNNKNIQGYFGAAIGGVTRAGNGSAWTLTWLVVRTAAGSQEAWIDATVNGFSNTVVRATLSQDETAAIVIKVTGTNGTANANDIVFRGWVIEAIN